jgi:phage gpG-like protein
MAEMIQGYASLQRRIAAIKGPVLGKSIMQTLAMATRNEAGNLVPHKTRNLARSIHVAEVTDTTARVVASANYAAAVEFGSKAHIIRPTAARIAAGKNFLAWASSSSKGIRLTGRPSSAKGNVTGWAYAAIVHHPGTRPHPFLRPGAEKAITSAGLLDRVVAAWNKAG